MQYGSWLGIVVSSVLLGCQPQAQLPDVPVAPSMSAAQMLCEPPPAQVIEVHVPVPLPGQLQAEPDLTREAEAPKKGERVGRQTKQTPINSVTEYRYVDGALYQAYVALGKATTILLAPGETFHQAIVGDKAVWSAEELALGAGEQQRSGVWLSCNEVGRHSTLTITGSQHLYLLEVHCTGATFHASISWLYARPTSVGVVQGTRVAGVPTPDEAVPTPEAPSVTRYAWQSNREVNWAPLYVYDTGTRGQQTIIVFPRTLSTTDAPVLYVRSPEGTQGLVNYRVRQGYWLGDRIYPVGLITSKLGVVGESLTYYLVDRIASEMELRVGETKPTIVTIRQQ